MTQTADFNFYPIVKNRLVDKDPSMRIEYLYEFKKPHAKNKAILRI